MQELWKATSRRRIPPLLISPLALWWSARWLSSEAFDILPPNKEPAGNLQSLQALSLDKLCDGLAGDAAQPRSLSLRNPFVQ